MDKYEQSFARLKKGRHQNYRNGKSSNPMNRPNIVRKKNENRYFSLHCFHGSITGAHETETREVLHSCEDECVHRLCRYGTECYTFKKVTDTGFLRSSISQGEMEHIRDFAHRTIKVKEDYSSMSKFIKNGDENSVRQLLADDKYDINYSDHDESDFRFMLDHSAEVSNGQYRVLSKLCKNMSYQIFLTALDKGAIVDTLTVYSAVNKPNRLHLLAIGKEKVAALKEYTFYTNFRNRERGTNTVGNYALKTKRFRVAFLLREWKLLSENEEEKLLSNSRACFIEFLTNYGYFETTTTGTPHTTHENFLALTDLMRYIASFL